MTCTFTEPTLEDLLADPVVHLVINADGLSRALVREWMEAIRQSQVKGPKPSGRPA